MSQSKSMSGLHILPPVFTHGYGISFFYISPASPRAINEMLNRDMIPAIIVIQKH